MVSQNISIQCRYFGLLIWTLVRRATRFCCAAVSLLFPRNPQHSWRIYRIMGRTCLYLVDISPCLLLSATVSQLIASRVHLQMLIACHISVVCLKFNFIYQSVHHVNFFFSVTDTDILKSFDVVTGCSIPMTVSNYLLAGYKHSHTFRHSLLSLSSVSDK